MKRKYRLKRSAKNDFTRLTGIQAIQLTGGSECLVVGQKSMLLPSNITLLKKKAPIKFVAAYLYLTHSVAVYNKEPITTYFTFDEILRVKQLCGVPECVDPQHLEVKLQADDRPY